MKRIEFIAPVDSMRGNLSGRQDLVYPTSDNKAYDSPVGSRNYARNYRASFIGAKRASDALKYFAVRTKSAIGMTQKVKKNMALQGGVGAMFAKIISSSTFATQYGFLVATYNAQSFAEPTSFRKWLSGKLRKMILTHSEQVVIGAAPKQVTIKNPWFDGTQTTGIEVSDEILVKFWTELASNGFYFYVEGQKGIAFDEMSFDDVYSNANLNVLGLSVETIGSDEYVKQGGLYLLDGTTYVQSSVVIVAGKKYDLTSVAPTA